MRPDFARCDVGERHVRRQIGVDDCLHGAVRSFDHSQVGEEAQMRDPCVEFDEVVDVVLFVGQGVTEQTGRLIDERTIGLVPLAMFCLAVLVGKLGTLREPAGAEAGQPTERDTCHKRQLSSSSHSWS